MAKQLALQDIVLVGRTYDEYCGMFDLDLPQLRRETVLDVAAGVSSFCAEAHRHGITVTASDRIYRCSAGEIAAKCEKDLAHVMAQMPALADMYVWQHFADVPALQRQRERAYTTFVADYAVHGQARYVPTDYPVSRFADRQFTLTLVSHFLLLYDEHLSYDFHRQTLLELLRVTRGEVRIFPLLNLKGERSACVDRLIADPAFAGCRFTVKRIGYEFLHGANEMLSITPPPRL